MSWIAWDKMTKPKNAGGLGFRDVEEFNDALLAKLSWRILSAPTSLFSRVLLGKYCHSSSFLSSSPPSNASHGWRGILAGRRVLEKGLGWLVGNGESIKVWDDPWLSTTEPLRPMGPPPLHLVNIKVSELLNPTDMSWNWSCIREILPAYKSHTRLLTLGLTRHEDSLVWLRTRNGIYTTRSGYGTKELEPGPTHFQQFDWQRKLWKLRTQPKIKSFLWKAAVGALPVGDQLVKRGLGDGGICKRCGESESIEHLLFHCTWAQQVWALAPMTTLRLTEFRTMLDYLSATCRVKLLPPTGITSASLASWICWNLWTARNLLIFEGTSLKPEEVMLKAIRYP